MAAMAMVAGAAAAETGITAEATILCNGIRRLRIKERRLTIIKRKLKENAEFAERKVRCLFGSDV